MKNIAAQDNKDWREFWRYALYRYWKLSSKKDKTETSPRERHWQAVKDTIQPVCANRYPPRKPQNATGSVEIVKTIKVSL